MYFSDIDLETSKGYFDGIGGNFSDLQDYLWLLERGAEEMLESDEEDTMEIVRILMMNILHLELYPQKVVHKKDSLESLLEMKTLILIWSSSGKLSHSVKRLETVQQQTLTNILKGGFKKVM